MARDGSLAFVKHWLPVLVTGAAIIYRVGIMQEKAMSHMADSGVHMPYQEKAKVFVTRPEWVKLETQLVKIAEKQTSILIAISRVLDERHVQDPTVGK